MRGAREVIGIKERWGGGADQRGRRRGSILHLRSGSICGISEVGLRIDRRRQSRTTSWFLFCHRCLVSVTDARAAHGGTYLLFSSTLAVGSAVRRESGETACARGFFYRLHVHAFSHFGGALANDALTRNNVCAHGSAVSKTTVFPLLFRDQRRTWVRVLLHHSLSPLAEVRGWGCCFCWTTDVFELCGRGLSRSCSCPSSRAAEGNFRCS